jgi:hypothetical protein
MEGDVAELVRHDAVVAKRLALRLGAFEYLQNGPLRVFEADHVVDPRLGVLLARRSQPVRRGLLLEGIEIVIRPELEPDLRAAWMRARAQDD